MTDIPGKYLTDERLDIMIEALGHDFSWWAGASIRNLDEPKEVRLENRQRMIDCATVYTGLRMLREERKG